jgi:hypothetical protein
VQERKEINVMVWGAGKISAIPNLSSFFFLGFSAHNTFSSLLLSIKNITNRTKEVSFYSLHLHKITEAVTVIQNQRMVQCGEERTDFFWF